MKQFKKLNTIFGWSVFLIASFVYLSTIEQTVSFLLFISLETHASKGPELPIQVVQP